MQGWDEPEIVLFDRRSGDTHLITENSFLLLSTLSAATTPLSVTALADRLRSTCEPATDDSMLLEFVVHTLSALQRVGLVSPQHTTTG